MLTLNQVDTYTRILKDYNFKSDFNWWINDKNKEIFLRLDDFTVFGVHPSGIVTEHKSSKPSNNK